MTYRVLSAEKLLEHCASIGPVLGIDTGSPAASLGVVANGRIMASLERRVMSHGADLPQAVNEVVAEAGFGLDDLTGVAVAIGPGSFTGLRVGLAYAKGLVMGSRLAIAGVPTLDAMALCASKPPGHPELSVCPILDARKGEVYAALYRARDDALEKVTSDLVVPLEELASRISGDVILVGESKADEALGLLNGQPTLAKVAGASELRLRGCYVAALGAAKLLDGQADHAVALEPLYVRPAEATAKLAAVNPGEGAYGTSRGRSHSTARSS